jgi:N-methylhydantoinase A
VTTDHGVDDTERTTTDPGPGPGPRVLGVDVGGTFTDLVLAEAERIEVAKVPSTPEDQAEGVAAGLARLGADAASLARFVHGTTVATNTVLERDGARVVLVTTAGFGDLLHLARQDRPHLYDLAARRPDPVVEREHVVETDERIGADGSVVRALADDEVGRVVDAVTALEPDAVAISLLFSFLAPAHEERLAEALEVLGVPVTRASALLPVLREVERTSTVALNAYVAPRMARYLGSLTGRLRDAGLRSDIEVMRSGGGTFTAPIAATEPVHTLLSGPAAGAWGAAALGVACGAGDLIAFDVGGTSTDVTLVSSGRPATTADGSIGGLPFAVATTDIHTIGAGGGSLAWRDDGGALRVGPRSAGAVPGPAAYGHGGTDATVTDANVVLGRLDASVRLGGAMPLHPGRARDAVAAIGALLDLDPVACAEGIVRVADAQMAAALRVVSVERGRDPRRFALLPFGGAGPLHQAALARELGTPLVLVPPNPGVLSAAGLLAAPITAERARSRVDLLDHLDTATLEASFAALAHDATSQLAAQDVEVAAARWTADLRYHGQAFELEVVAGTGDAGEGVSPGALAAAFHTAHHERYGYAQPDEPVELVTLRVRVEGPARSLPLPRLRGGGGVAAATIGRREVTDDGGRVEAAIVDRQRLGAGATLRGPAVVIGVDATVWVAPWQRGEVDGFGVLHLVAADDA